MYYSPYPFYYRYPVNTYPPVDTTLFQQSLQTYPSLLEKGRDVVQHFTTSSVRMQQLMTAAQAGQDEEVDRIMQEVAGPFDVRTTYTPMSVTFTISINQANAAPQCCRLQMYLRWG
ncbi:hypothetical protein HXA31_18900 [Salipaludibacillus agaradhaerens]|uniref:Uncharacterized protein n=1 Tax=Salipaludibacillus agaradhaerens TaxID=76935 RepID=A0A9Q4B468_SALAG|nr:hypothetical protein [Salipaludibacillus agaradhaerens]MCR6097961.1 hypothetical protein [Salipaludibacillus agaradhaerens]MCR6116410.1 hypothetical protein [Salipaludibacillus agaradhaerens]